jgi:hypothetical protein
MRVHSSAQLPHSCDCAKQSNIYVESYVEAVLCTAAHSSVLSILSNI